MLKSNSVISQNIIHSVAKKFWILHTVTCSCQWDAKFQHAETKNLSSDDALAFWNPWECCSLKCRKSKGSHWFLSAALHYSSQTRTYKPEWSAQVSTWHMHNVLRLQTLWTKEEITLIFTAPVWDKYKMIAYPVLCFIWRFYLTGLWMQLLCPSTRLAKLPESIN